MHTAHKSPEWGEHGGLYHHGARSTVCSYTKQYGYDMTTCYLTGPRSHGQSTDDGGFPTWHEMVLFTQSFLFQEQTFFVCFWAQKSQQSPYLSFAGPAGTRLTKNRKFYQSCLRSAAYNLKNVNNFLRVCFALLNVSKTFRQSLYFFSSPFLFSFKNHHCRQTRQQMFIFLGTLEAEPRPV